MLCKDHDFDIPEKNADAYGCYAIKLSLWQKQFVGIMEVRFFENKGKMWFTLYIEFDVRVI